jgi:hypothetical protein
VIDRARHASGALDGVPATPYNGVDTAREIARTAAAEFRADLVANAAFHVGYWAQPPRPGVRAMAGSPPR